MGDYGTASGIVIGIDPADGKGKVLALTDGNIQASLSEDGLTWAGGKGRADNLGLRFDYDPATYWQFEADEWAALFTAAIATLDDDDDARFAGKFIQTGGQGDSGALRVLGSVTGIFAESESGRAISASSTYGIPLILYAGTGQGTDGRALVIMSGNVDGGGGRYTNMGNATVATDGLNRQTGDARYAGIAYTDHGALAGLGDDDHSQYLLATGARAGSTSQAQNFGATGIKADVIAESTGAAGVTVDGLLIKDGSIHAAADSSIDGILTMTPQQIAGILTASDAGENDYFGGSVALSSDGSILAVGARLWDGGAGANQGAVYVYDWSGSAWVERSGPLTASDAGAGDQFGNSVALSSDGSILAVGAYAWDGGAGSGQGAVYSYSLVANRWPWAPINDGTGWAAQAANTLVAHAGGERMRLTASTVELLDADLEMTAGQVIKPGSDTTSAIGFADNGGTLLSWIDSTNGTAAIAGKTPASAGATGAPGQICWDSNYIYICTATNTWKRVAISTW